MERGKRHRRDTRTSEHFSGCERRRPQLSLGDFIFYSIQLGKAPYDSSRDFNTILACYLATCVGLCTTLFLVIVQRVLPSLPTLSHSDLSHSSGLDLLFLPS